MQVLVEEDLVCQVVGDQWAQAWGDWEMLDPLKGILALLGPDHNNPWQVLRDGLYAILSRLPGVVPWHQTAKRPPVPSLLETILELGADRKHNSRMRLVHVEEYCQGLLRYPLTTGHLQIQFHTANKTRKAQATCMVQLPLLERCGWNSSLLTMQVQIAEAEATTFRMEPADTVQLATIFQNEFLVESEVRLLPTSFLPMTGLLPNPTADTVMVQQQYRHENSKLQPCCPPTTLLQRTHSRIVIALPGLPGQEEEPLPTWHKL